MKKVSDPIDDTHSSAMRRRSGAINTKDLVVTFLYVLMRDQVTPGAVEHVMLQLAAESETVKRKEMWLTNGWLAKHAMDIADRLSGKIKVKTTKPVTEPLLPTLVLKGTEYVVKRPKKLRKKHRAAKKA